MSQFVTSFNFGSQLLIFRLNKYSFFFPTLGWKLSNDKGVGQVEIKIPVLFLKKLEQRMMYLDLAKGLANTASQDRVYLPSQSQAALKNPRPFSSKAEIYC